MIKPPLLTPPHVGTIIIYSKRKLARTCDLRDCLRFLTRLYGKKKRVSTKRYQLSERAETRLSNQPISNISSLVNDYYIMALLQ